MTTDRMIELLRIEKRCVLLFSGRFREDPGDNDETPTRCTRDCAHCDLVQDDEELLEMYDAVIFLIQKLQKACPYDPQYVTNVNLNHDDYVRVGDVLDCFSGMDLNDDAVFHGLSLVEWAMSRRSVPKEKLSKKQKPRVLTLEEVKHARDEPAYWFEDSEGYMTSSLSVFYEQNRHSISFTTEDKEGYLEGYTYPNTQYGKTWRCWSSKPTEEQRKAVKWDDMLQG